MQLSADREDVALVLPGEPLPVRLMNTVWADRRGVHDTLSTTQGLRAWLVDVDLLCDDPGEPAEADRRHAVRVRDALRRLAALRTGDGRAAAASPVAAADAVRILNAAARAAVPEIVLVDGALGRTDALPARDVDRAVGAVAAQAVDLLTRDDAVLRVCYAPGCVLYFVRDHPRREWCSTACGNRARAARHYRRHHGGAGSSG